MFLQFLRTIFANVRFWPQAGLTGPTFATLWPTWGLAQLEPRSKSRIIALGALLTVLLSLTVQESLDVLPMLFCQEPQTQLGLDRHVGPCWHMSPMSALFFPLLSSFVTCAELVFCKFRNLNLFLTCCNPFLNNVTQVGQVLWPRPPNSYHLHPLNHCFEAQCLVL